MITVLLATMAYAAVHSLLASNTVKGVFQRIFDDRIFHGLYRVLYNVVAVVTFIPVWLLVQAPQNAEIVWQFDENWKTFLLIIQGIGLVGVVIAVLQINWMRFGGVSQLLAYLLGKKLPFAAETLQTGGFYAFSRHPLYLFSLLAIWPVQVISEGYLGLCIGISIYFVVGSFLEERRMIADLGQDYLDYRERVPWMLPVPRPNRQA